MASYFTSLPVQRFAGALYGLKLGSSTLDDVQGDLSIAPGASLEEKLDGVFNFYYSITFGAASAEDVAARMLANLDIVEGEYGLDAAEVAVAEDYIIAALNGAPSGQWGAVINDILVAFAGLTADAQYGAVATAWSTKVQASLAYGEANEGNAAIDAVAPEVTTFKLTVGFDGLDGTDGADRFISNVEQNAAGLQVNTLGSGDLLDGGAGTDTLIAKITSGAFVNGGNIFGTPTMPIQPETTSIEVVKLEAVNSYIAGPALGLLPSLDDTFESLSNSQVYVNAKDMTDVEQLWSSYSDADLIIQNLTTLGSDGEARSVSDMTIGMQYTGNADSAWGESDYTVYFDQDYLTPIATRGRPSVDIQAMNEDAYDETDGDLPLAGVFFRQLTVTLNGETVDLADFLGEDGENGAGEEIQTYADLLAAIQDAIAEVQALNPTNAALQTLTAEFGPEFEADVDPVTLEIRVGTSIRLSVDGLTDGVANTLEVASTDLEVARAAAATVENNNRYERADNDPPEEGTVLSINVALEKVGLAGDGGELIIGSMNKAPGNEWDAVNSVTDTTSGIEQFDVTVYGANDKSSSLSGLHSTNNNLRVVNVVTDAAQTGTFADLTIGNSNTDGLDLDDGVPSLDNANALKDVQTFDASGFKGDLTLFAALTAEVTAKYLDLQDESPDAPAADNVDFEYTGGTGDDYFNIALDTSNEAFAGTVTREDFQMNATVDGGDGDDTIVLAMVGEDGLELAGNWYANHKLLQNVAIDGGAGDDTIWTPGSGDVIIDAGTGNDTVYADNTGAKAVWALNSLGGGLNNLLSDTNDEYRLFKTDVRVSFMGFESTADIIDVRGVATDLDINQAIKRAINSDAELSKLLVAKDGPANTLVITSLIDGVLVDDALMVTLVAPAVSAITAGEANQLSTWYASANLTPAAAKAIIDAAVLVFNDNEDSLGDAVYNMTRLNNGSDSDHTSDNTITGGLGNDVLVLGTGEDSNDTLVYEGFGNGTDTIVHFVASVTEETEIGADNPVSVEVTTEGAEAVAAADEIAATFELKVSAATADGDVVFLDEDAFGDLGAGNLAVEVLEGDTAAEVAAAIVADWPVTSDYSVALDPADSSNLIFTERTPTGITEPDEAALLAAVSSTAGVLVTVENIVDGSFGTPEVFAATEEITVTFGSPTINGLFQFDGDEFPILENDSAEDVANTFFNGEFTEWVVVGLGPVDNLDGTWSVVLESTTPDEDIADVTIADFTGDINLNAEVIVTTEFASDSDYLDFSSYGAVAVQVISTGTNEVFFDTPAATELWVRLTESSTNDGEYRVELVREGGTAADTVVGLIGVTDFGVEQNFVAENFII